MPKKSYQPLNESVFQKIREPLLDQRKNDSEETDLSESMIRKAFQANPNDGILCLFHCYHALLCSHAVRFVSSRAIAEDIVSDIFYEFHSRDLYQTITISFRAYLFTAVRNRAFDYVRREMQRSNSLEHASHVTIQPGQEPDSITQYEDLYHDVESAIDSMPIKRRQIYIMHRFDGRKSQEIAAELGISVRTVEAHLYQALRQIKNQLSAKWFMLLLFFLD
ncbi:RNA polymerase sigma-70 factor [Arundinibacter roseus]|uniref:RNA polymerase sigma-70 factor n=1 Tax=Arundinibacter roseus TaxID=2070510 RepID=A0A4R4KLS6_9BACT|nr:RNA polymerase sigma-70 factor [Arundinibacter roseus]TDB67902.1 RNA polymerase sigma-70 factor [Arundinibacter roseus]